MSDSTKDIDTASVRNMHNYINKIILFDCHYVNQCSKCIPRNVPHRAEISCLEMVMRALNIYHPTYDDAGLSWKSVQSQVQQQRIAVDNLVYCVWSPTAISIFESLYVWTHLSVYHKHWREEQ